jgi:predicted metalloprotease with PDZ domain
MIQKFFLLFVTCWLSASSFFSHANAEVAWSTKPVTLRIKPILENGQFRAIDVSYEFVAPKATKKEKTITLKMALPNEWGGERTLYQSITDISAVGATLTPTEEPAFRTLTAAPGATITIRYRVIHVGKEARKQFGNDYRPIITPTYFHLLGNAIVPEIEGMWLGSPAKFVLDGMPSNSSFASDLEHQTMGRKLNVADLIESVLVGGDFRVLDAGSGARLAIRGKWAREDAIWQQQFARIAASQREFWGAKSEPFLVTIIDLPDMAPGSTSVGGTGRSDAFAFFATTNAQPERIDQTMAHEMMHSWIPRRIGRLPNEREQLTYWLSEGFTEWASWRAMVRGGLFTAEDFARAFNESLKAYESSPVRNATNQAILDGFWRDPAVQSLPYQRGMLVATYWDDVVRRKTKGQRHFEHVLLEMQRIANATPNAVGKPVEYLKAAMMRVAKYDISQDLRDFIDDGKTPPLEEDIFAECGTLQQITRKVFHRGFDIQASLKANNEIKGVIVDGPAYAAGLRDGMKMLGRNGGVIGDSLVEIAYDVMDGETKKTLRWMPEGAGTEMIREFKLHINFNADTRLQCGVRLGLKE